MAVYDGSGFREYVGILDIDYRISVGSRSRVDIEVIRGEWEVYKTTHGVLLVNIDVDNLNITTATFTKYATLKIENKLLIVSNTDYILEDSTISTLMMPEYYSSLVNREKNYGMLVYKNNDIGTYFKSSNKNVDIYTYEMKLVYVELIKRG